VDEIVPWGEDTLLTLQFRDEENKYAIHTSSDTFLQKDGKLTSEINEVNKKKIQILIFDFFFKV